MTTPPKKTSRQRSEAQRERDLVEIARRLLRRESQQSIAEALGLAQSLISKEVKLLKSRWRDRAVLDFHDFLAEELALSYHVEAEAWKGWAASRTAAVTETDQVKDTALGAEISSTTRTQKQSGDPRMLEQILMCSKRRLELMGLLNPGDVPGGMDYLAQVREEDAFLEEHGHTIDEVLKALEEGPADDEE